MDDAVEPLAVVHCSGPIRGHYLIESRLAVPVTVARASGHQVFDLPRSRVCFDRPLQALPEQRDDLERVRRARGIGSD